MEFGFLTFTKLLGEFLMTKDSSMKEFYLT